MTIARREGESETEREEEREGETNALVEAFKLRLSATTMGVPSPTRATIFLFR